VFKEWKSYANLHAFDTTKVAIVEGLIWTAIAAAALKRFLAHMTQLLLEVPMSTRKVAMCAVHVLGDIVRACSAETWRGSLPRWRRPSHIWHVMPGAHIPSGTGIQDAPSWVSNPSWEMRT